MLLPSVMGLNKVDIDDTSVAILWLRSRYDEYGEHGQYGQYGVRVGPLAVGLGGPRWELNRSCSPYPLLGAGRRRSECLRS